MSEDSFHSITVGIIIINVSNNELMLGEKKLDQNDMNILLEHLPFTTNAIDSICRYSERTEVFKQRVLGKDAYTIEFKSEYNPHIWYSPILWLIPTSDNLNEVEMMLRSSMKLTASFIAMAPVNSACASIVIPGIKIYREKLLQKLTNTRNTVNSRFQIRRLDESDAEQSIALSSTVEPNSIMHDPLTAEKLFLRERETYGIYFDNTLVTRGSIMANVRNYSSVGGFVTHPDYRKMGFASALVSYICSIVQDRAQIPFLTVREDNFAAISLYSKLGFEFSNELLFFDYNSQVVP